MVGMLSTSMTSLYHTTLSEGSSMLGRLTGRGQTEVQNSLRNRGSGLCQDLLSCPTGSSRAKGAMGLASRLHSKKSYAKKKSGKMYVCMQSLYSMCIKAILKYTNPVRFHLEEEEAT